MGVVLAAPTAEPGVVPCRQGSLAPQMLRVAEFQDVVADIAVDDVDQTPIIEAVHGDAGYFARQLPAEELFDGVRHSGEFFFAALTGLPRLTRLPRGWAKNADQELGHAKR